MRIAAEWYKHRFRPEILTSTPSTLLERVDDAELLLDQLSVVQVFGKEDVAVSVQGGGRDD